MMLMGLPVLSYAQQNPYAPGGAKTYTAEQQTRDMGQNQANLMLKYENMLTKIGELTGKIEELRHSNELLQNKIDKMNVKIGNLENEINTLKGRVHVSTPPEVPVVRDEEKKASYKLDAKKAYDEAKAIFDAKKYVEAMTAFRKFVKNFSDSHYVSNAKFWVAECYYRLGDYDKAILAYDEVINSYSKSVKVPDSYYKEALAFMKLGDDIDGRFLLKKLIKLYPDSIQAKEAQKILEKK
jgi:tol-pal system protein YbgF